MAAAVAALEAWAPGDREPAGWHRHPRSDRYRPDTTPASEFRPADGPPPGHRHPWTADRGWTPIGGGGDDG